jgi:two-component system LytT family sensor kinase
MSTAAQPSNVPVGALRVSRWKWGIVLFVVWTILAFTSIAQIAIAFNQRGQPFPWRFIVPERLIDWYTCAIFTPVCFWLVRRYPLDEIPWRRALPGYLLATTICVVLKCVLMVGIMSALGGTNQTTLARAFAQDFLFDLVILWGVIAVVQALELHLRLSQREQLAFELRAQLSEAELQVLKGQLQPHFLFNTLNGVASLIHSAPETADFIVVQLADLLRASLDHDSAREIPLSDELILLDKYLAIMEARFRGRLSINRDIEDDARCALVPQFLLQPLVENAFEHGIGRRAGAGCISIHIRIADATRLHLEVSDDGAGLSAERLPDVGVGLGNTRKRLRRLYGDAQSLLLLPVSGGGARAVVEIPFRSA